MTQRRYKSEIHVKGTVITYAEERTVGHLWWTKVVRMKWYLLEGKWYDFETDLEIEPADLKRIDSKSKMFQSIVDELEKKGWLK